MLAPHILSILVILQQSLKGDSLKNNLNITKLCYFEPKEPFIVRFDYKFLNVFSKIPTNFFVLV